MELLEKNKIEMNDEGNDDVVNKRKESLAVFNNQVWVLQGVFSQKVQRFRWFGEVARTAQLIPNYLFVLVAFAFCLSLTLVDMSAE